MRFIHYGIVALVLSAYGSATAQDAGSLLNDRERSEQLELPDQDLSPSELRELPGFETAALSGPVVEIVEVQFEGNTALLGDELTQEFIDQIVGVTVDFAAIESFAQSITTALRQRGYLLSRAILPPQDVTEGVLRIEISQAPLAGVQLESQNKVRAKSSILQKIIASEIDDDRPIGKSLDSALLRLNDWPGLEAKSRLSASNTPGASDLIVQVSQEPLAGLTVGADNLSSPSTGREQAYAQLSLVDAIGIGDLTQLTASFSEGQTFTSISVGAPIRASKFAVDASFSYLDYENVDEVGKAAGLNGEAQYANASLVYQPIRSRAQTVEVIASVATKSLKDDSSAGTLSDKQIDSGTLGVSFTANDKVFGGGITQAALSSTWGDLDLSGQPVAEFIDSISAQTQGSYQRVNATTTRLQSIADDLALELSASGQWASKNLDSAESISIGGPSGVRAWPVGEGRGDAGALVSAELRYDFGVLRNVGRVRVSAFADSGWIRINEKPEGLALANACACNEYQLSGAGFGVQLSRGNFAINAVAAAALGPNPGRSGITGNNVDGESDRGQIWVTGSYKF